MRRFQLSRLGSSRRLPKGSRRRPEVNQDSPDPEEPLEHSEFQQLATIYARSCHPMWSLLAFMPDFAVFYSLKCQSLRRFSPTYSPPASLASQSRAAGPSWRTLFEPNEVQL
jgi:hypothetical protein